ncbi:MAG: hypothetical protein ACI9MR_001739 [Myxococcota bacterium]|jgi:hypothetical protein
MRRVLLACSTLALVLAGHSATLAKPDGPSASAHSHDSGFFMRLAVGTGYHNTSTEAGFGDTSLSGLGGNASFAFGGIVARNLALHATFFLTTAINPTLEVNGIEGNTEETQMTAGGLGIGVTYYTSSNIYFGASFGAAVAQLEVQREKGDSELGFGGTAIIGKEWWVSRRWGIGLAAQFIFVRVPTERDSIQTLGAGLLFSATLN